MEANVLGLGLGFYKLVQVKDSDLREDVECYDGADTRLLENYVLATDDYDYVSCEAGELGTVELVRVNTLAVIGSAGGEVRCYEKEVTAYKDAKGDLWMDAELHDEIFC
jgi:hypothetical protein